VRFSHSIKTYVLRGVLERHTRRRAPLARVTAGRRGRRCWGFFYTPFLSRFYEIQFYGFA
jgi:hypothetical protein